MKPFIYQAVLPTAYTTVEWVFILQENYHNLHGGSVFFRTIYTEFAKNDILENGQTVAIFTVKRKHAK